MEFTHKQKSFINYYASEINNGNASIFAGAGLSASIGFVNWKELMRDLAADLDLNIEVENDYVRIAQYHYNKFKRGKINNTIVNAFTTLSSGTENHQILAKLNIDTFWTTNYDQLIEKSLEHEKKTVELKIRNKDFARNIKKKDAIVYKMHGDKNSPDDAILIKDDYDKYHIARELFSTALRGDLLSKTFLFIGFSFDDPNLDFIMSKVKVLLEDNTPTHYCFLKSTKREDYNNNEDFLYAQIKQNLRTDDLLRYGIHTVFIEEYSDITYILKEIEIRTKRRNIFISGAAADYSPLSEDIAKELIHSLSFRLAQENYKIVSGYGLGIGSMVINGALDYKLNSHYRNLDDLLILRPFPQISSGSQDIKAIWKSYRHDMISHSGIAIFLFGNKLDKNQLVNSNGMVEEFEICIEHGVIPIPIGLTGSISKELWNKVSNSLDIYYPENTIVQNSILELNSAKLSNSEIINLILTIILQLQKV